MSEQILRPNAAGDIGELSCIGTPYEYVSDESDATYIYRSGSGTLEHLFKIPSMNASSAIAKITVYARAKHTADYVSDGIYIYIKYSDGNTNTSSRISITTSWATKSMEWATSPKTGNAWTEDEINGLQIGVKATGLLASGFVQISEIYLVVDYTPVSAPTVSNDGEDDLAATSVTLQGSITDNGGQDASSLKFVYKVGAGGDEVEVVITGDGSAQQYTYELTGLAKGTEYYYKFVAENGGGETSSDWDTFITLTTAPAGTYDSISGQTATTFTLNGTISDDGGQNCTSRGFHVGLTKDIYTLYKDDGAYNEGTFSKEITGLSANTSYWTRVVITNADGTYTGTWYQISTAAQGSIPTRQVINIVSDYGGYGYNVNKAVTDDGENYTGYFEFSTDMLGEMLGIMINKRLLEVWIYINSQTAGSLTLKIKENTETTWQTAGVYSMIDSKTIARVFLPVDYRAIIWEFRLESTSYFEFLGLIGGYFKDGIR